jgi:retron-type reverse transcriptase
MKRHGNLWPQVVSFPNLVAAARLARRGKRSRDNVAAFEVHLERELCRLQDDLRTKQYLPGAYRTFWIHDPKKRLISAAPYRDRVVHHALCRVLQPIFERSFISDSYASRPGKGTHAALNRCTQFMRKYAYVLKCDVRKYFPSIDHEVLKEVIARRIKDRDVLWLVERILDHANEQEEVQEWYCGDDLFSPLERRHGLPIGNQTSQFFANVYLDSFDHWLKQDQRMSAYIRYMDDFVLFSDDKERLAVLREQCAAFLDGIRLRLHPKKSVISRTRDGVRFLGLRVFRAYRLLPRENIVRMRRRVRWMQREYAAARMHWPGIYCRMMSWQGHARHADAYQLRERICAEAVFRRQTAV